MLSRYEPKKKRAQSTELSSNTSLISRLPNYLMHYVLQWNDPSTIYHVGVSVTLHWFILTRSILAPLSPTVFRKSLSLKSQLILFHFFLLEIMILLLLGNAHAQKFFFCSIVSSLAAFWRVFFFVSWGPRRFTCSNMSGLNGREIYVDGKNPKLMHTWCAFYYDLTAFGAA